MTDKAPTPKTDTEDIEDLDLMMTSRALDPKKIRLFGRVWTVKRDFTAEQMAQFWAEVDKATARGTLSAEAMTMLVGKGGADFAKTIGVMPAELVNPVLRRVYVMAGLLKRVDGDPAGESPAS